MVIELPDTTLDLRIERICHPDFGLRWTWVAYFGSVVVFWHKEGFTTRPLAIADAASVFGIKPDPVRA